MNANGGQVVWLHLLFSIMSYLGQFVMHGHNIYRIDGVQYSAAPATAVPVPQIILRQFRKLGPSQNELVETQTLCMVSASKIGEGEGSHPVTVHSPERL